MRFSSYLMLLALVSCATQKYQQIPDVAYQSDAEAYRQVASAGQPMVYPSNVTFDLAQVKGQTYITFLKNKLKPALDQYNDRKSGGGGGFQNVGASVYKKNAASLSPKTLSKYKGAKWDGGSRTYKGGLSDAEVETVFETLKKIRPTSTVDSLGYFDRNDKEWPKKNDMAVALKEANIRGDNFDLGTLYALTSGIGVKVKIDENNYNYHTMYKVGKLNPHEEVMSGRSFASSFNRGAADATDPEYLRDLQKFLNETPDQRAFYKALILSIANSDPSGFRDVSPFGQAVLGDFLTVYTAEAVRHLMVNLKDGQHPWEIDLAAVTVVSSVSAKTGKVVSGGQVVEDDLGAWFAPSPNNKPDGPQRSGIGITRRDRVKLQQAIHKFEMGTPDGAELIKKIQGIIGSQYNKDDVIQGVFEFLSNPYTPTSLGAKAPQLADLMSKFVELAHEDAHEIMKTVK